MTGIYKYFINDRLSLSHKGNYLSSANFLRYYINRCEEILFREVIDSSESVYDYVNKRRFSYNHDCYQTYLRSDPWKEKSIYIKEKYENKCMICRNKSGIIVGDKILPHILCTHHLTYENIYKERDEDLISLCKVCHDVIHKISKEKLFCFLNPHKNIPIPLSFAFLCTLSKYVVNELDNYHGKKIERIPSFHHVKNIF